MAEETFLTAARRLVRFVRVDDERHGGLLSHDSVQAADTLDKQVRIETDRLKALDLPADATAAESGR